MCLPVFGAPVLLKRKADMIMSDAAPPPPQQPSPPLPSKWLKRDQELLNEMRGLIQLGAHQLDTLQVVQMAAQEASGVMAAMMLHQQGAMWEVSAWESEMECTMREMVWRVEGEGSDL